METTITFKTAKLAKEKGFNWDTLHCFTNGGSLQYSSGDEDDNGVYNHNMWDNFSAPTQSITQKWLREVHGIHIVIIPTVISYWTYKTVRVVAEIDNDVIRGLRYVDSLPPYNDVCGFDFNTFEEAFEDGLYESLLLI